LDLESLSRSDSVQQQVSSVFGGRRKEEADEMHLGGKKMEAAREDYCCNDANSLVASLFRESRELQTA
jgi:hypothetical protein